MNELIDQLKLSEEIYSLKPVSLSQIGEAEQALGLAFAYDYKECLSVFGAFSLAAHEITGICDSERLNVVNVTNLYRTRFPELPRDLYVIEDLSIDHLIAVQKGDGTIYTYGPDKKLIKVATSLQEYLFPVALPEEHQKATKPQKGFLKTLFKKLLGK